MNRRDAIKKLAVGGAVASAGSVVLSSTNVAYAASAPGTGLTEVPAPGEPLPISFVPNTNGTVTLGDATVPLCAGGGAPTVTYSWKVNGFGFSGGNRHLLVVNASNLNEIIHDSTGSTGYSAPNLSHPTIELRKTNNGKKRTIKPLDSGDTYNVSVIISWSCQGAGASLEAEYTFNGTGSNPPSVANTAYNII